MARKANARAFAVDLMKGERVVGQRKQTASGDGLAIGITAGAYDQRAGQPVEDASFGTSIFDPVLCELAYRWFSPPGGVVIDPFAGGSVRGIVAAWLGRRYHGIDLRPEQVAANQQQWAAIGSDREAPQWVTGDGLDIAALLPDVQADFLLTCPPYGDLERYSDDPRDISTMDYDAFLATFRRIIAASVRMLRTDRFACIVVGDLRDKQGYYRNFPGHTIQAFEDAGARLYNEAILVTAAGSLPLRTGKQFEAARKLGKTHQQVYVFCKGNPARATKAIGPVEFGDPQETGVETDGAPDPDAAYGTRL